MKLLQKSGFTIIELLVVLTILGIVSMSLVPTAEIVTVRLLESDLQNNLSTMRHAIKEWRNDCERAIERGIQAFPGMKNSAAALATIPYGLFYPPSIGSMSQNIPYTVKWPAPSADEDWGVGGEAVFYPRVYLREIPKNPFAQGVSWTQFYASATVGNDTSTYTQGLIDPPGIWADASGVFDVSTPPATETMKGFVQALDGTFYKDW